MEEQRIFLTLSDLKPRLREAVLQRSAFCVRSLVDLFRTADEEPDRDLSLYDELPDVLGDAGIVLNRTEDDELARVFDYSETGTSTWGEVFGEIFPPLTESRLEAVERVFASLGDGDEIPSTSLKPKVQGEGPPRVLRMAIAKKPGDKLRDKLIHAFEEEEIISKEEFIAFYRSQSAAYNSDSEFISMLTESWKN